MGLLPSGAPMSSLYASSGYSRYVAFLLYGCAMILCKILGHIETRCCNVAGLRSTREKGKSNSRVKLYFLTLGWAFIRTGSKGLPESDQIKFPLSDTF